MTQEEAEFAGRQVLDQLHERKLDRHKDYNRNIFSVRTDDLLAKQIRTYCKDNNVPPNQFIKKFFKIISMTNSQFNFALPLPIKWSIGQINLNEKEVLSFTIPVDSVTHLIDHLKNLVNTKAKQGEVYDFNKKEKVKTQCIQIYSKAMEGPYGVFGNINPQKVEDAPDLNQMAF